MWQLIEVKNSLATFKTIFFCVYDDLCSEIEKHLKWNSFIGPTAKKSKLISLFASSPIWLFWKARNEHAQPCLPIFEEKGECYFDEFLVNIFANYTKMENLSMRCIRNSLGLDSDINVVQIFLAIADMEMEIFFY